MTVCLKCGAENSLGNKYCARCDMPLPSSGVGGTLTGEARQLLGVPPGAPARPSEDRAAHAPTGGTREPPRPPPEVALSPRTLFGIAPRAPQAGPANATPVGPATTGGRPPAFGGSTPKAVPDPWAMAPGAEARKAPAQAAASAPPFGENKALPQRTLMGVVSKDIAKAIDAARGAAPGTAALPKKAASGAARPTHGTHPDAFEPVRNATTSLSTPPAAAPLVMTPETAQANASVPNAWGAVGGVRAATAALPPADGSTAQPNPVEALAAAGLAKTHLGVAIPGIAPLRAGMAPPAAAAPTNQFDAASLPPELRRPSASPSVLPPGRFPLPRSALVLLITGLLLLACAAAFAMLWNNTKPLSAVLGSDAAGQDRIDIVCETCPDGTRIDLGGANAEVHERKAYLTPQHPLPLGENTLAFGVERPDTSKREEVELKLPAVEYRISPDASTLVGDQPRLTLRIEALPGTRVLLGDAPVSLDGQGRGALPIDVSARLMGQASEVTTFEHAIRYAIVPPSNKKYSGELRVKINVTPLLLEAPGTDTVTDIERFMLAGRTSKGGQVWVAGSPLAVDDEGRFAQLMSIDAVGETQVTLRATQPGLAPRFATFRLERVKSLTAAANKLRQGLTSLATAAEDLEAHLGSKVWVKGKIEDVRVDGHRSLLVLQADGDCTGRFCLARLIYGGLRKLERGTSVTAIGRLQRAAGAANVPEIDVSLLL